LQWVNYRHDQHIDASEFKKEKKTKEAQAKLYNDKLIY
jgi:hypothetical protein